MKKITLEKNTVTWYTEKKRNKNYLKKTQESSKSYHKKTQEFSKRNYERRRNTQIKAIYNFPVKPKWFITLIVPGGCPLEEAHQLKQILNKLIKTTNLEFPNCKLGYKFEYKGHKPKDKPSYQNVGVHIHIWGRMGTRIKKSQVKKWFMKKWSRLIAINHTKAVNVKLYKEKHAGYLTKKEKKPDDFKVMQELHPSYNFGTIGLRKRKQKLNKVIERLNDKEFKQIQKILNDQNERMATFRNGTVSLRQLALVNIFPDGFQILDKKASHQLKEFISNKKGRK